MANEYNPGKINIEKATATIVKGGGGTNSSKNKDGSTHHTVYSRSDNRHFSYNKTKDGKITNVHSSKDGKPHTDYKGGR